MVGADAAGGDEHRLRVERELADDRRASSARPARAPLGSSTDPRTPVTAPPEITSSSTWWRKRSSTSPRAAASRTRRSNGSTTPGPGAPGEVEARHRVAVADRQVAAALGPADVGHELHAHPGQPRALLAGGEVDVRLGPAPRPLVLVAVEARGAQPVLPGELVRVLDAQPALLGAVDEHQPAEGPERLAAQRGLRLLVEEDDLAAGVGQLRGGDEAREPRADDDGVRVHRGVVPDRAR